MYMLLLMWLWLSFPLTLQQYGPTRGIQSTQDGIDAVQNERITSISRKVEDHDADIESLAMAVTEMSIQIRTYTSVTWIIGLVFGTIISSLQILQYFGIKPRSSEKYKP